MNIYIYNVSLIDTIHNIRKNIRINTINPNIVKAIAAAKKLAGNEYTLVESAYRVDVHEDIEKLIGSYYNDCFEAFKKLQSLMLMLTDACLASNPENHDKYVATKSVILNNIKTANTVLLEACFNNFHNFHEVVKK